ncbi:hypothetical protein JST97_04270 [bacterium]|nr:hypothetical protein [bacterium]
MMTVDAMLCDAATVREGLLNVLGAGITRLHREQFPAAMGTQMALLLHSTAKDMGKNHKLVITVTHESKEKIAEFSVEFSVGANQGAKADEVITVPLVATFAQQVLPQPGTYNIELNVDGKVARVLQFQAGLAPKPAAMPGSARG